MPAPHEDDLTQDWCAFCREEMQLLMESTPAFRLGGARLRACPSFGWWTYWRQVCSPVLEQDTGRRRWSLYGAAAELKTLDLSDLSLGLEEVRRFLVAKYEARFELNPRLFELSVASVFRDLGYDAEATAYRADGGVDVILRHATGSTSGVQIKRTRAAIEVEQIRALAGALMLAGHTAGVYITTSSFRSGARKAAGRLSELSLPVELIDAPRFLQMLRVSQVPPYASYEDWRDLFGWPPEDLPIYENELEGG